MNNLPKECYIGYMFARMDADGEYNLCCGTIPSSGSYEKDGRFLKYWKSDKLKKLFHGLKTDLKKYNSMWNGACEYCPHINTNNLFYDHFNDNKKLLDGHGMDVYLKEIKSDNFNIGPMIFSFEIINVCDHKCNFCWNWSYDMLDNDAQWDDWKDWAKKKMSFEMFKNTIDDLVELGGPSSYLSGDGGCEEIIICGGGEPLLHPRFMDMVSHIKKNKFYCIITTNFCRITEDQMDELIFLEANELIINVSAGTESIYTDTRRVKKTTWNKLLNNLNYISKRKKEFNSKFPQIIAKFIMTSSNVHEIGEMIDMAIKEGADTITLKRFLEDGVYNSENLMITDEQYNKFNVVLKDKLNQYKFKKFDSFEGKYIFNFNSFDHNVILRSDEVGLFNKIWKN